MSMAVVTEAGRFLTHYQDQPLAGTWNAVYLVLYRWYDQ